MTTEKTLTNFIYLARRRTLPQAAVNFINWLESNQDTATGAAILATIQEHGPRATAEGLRPFRLSDWLAEADRATYRKGMPILVNGAWGLPSEEGKLYLEQSDGRLYTAQVDAIPLSESKLRPWSGPHPRTQQGNPLPLALYAAFGLHKATQSAKTEKIMLRISPEEKERLEALAKDARLSVSDYFRSRIFRADDI